MTRERIVEIENSVIRNQINPRDISEVIIDFCLEKDASKRDLIEQCTALIIQQGAWEQYFKEALDYFGTKFNICKLMSEEKIRKINTPFGPQEEKYRDILLVQ